MNEKVEDKDWFPCILGVAFVGTMSLWYVKINAIVTDDAYGYLVIARAICEERSQTFNDLMSTNGFHPLWCYLLAFYYSILSLIGISCNNLVHGLPLVGLITAGTCYFLYKTCGYLDINKYITLSILYFYMTAFVLMYSEAYLFMLVLALLLFLVSHPTLPTNYRMFAIGLVAGLVFLARFDSFFFLGFLFLFLWHKYGLKRFLYSAIVGSIVCLPYLYINYRYFGGLVPVTGWLKSSFPHTWLVFFEQDGLASRFGKSSIALGWMPFLLGFVLMCWAVKSKRLAATSAGFGISISLFCGAFLNLTYVFLFSTGFAHFHWYYVLPMTFFAITAGVVTRHLNQTESRYFSTMVLASSLVFLFMMYPSSRNECKVRRPLEAIRYLDEHGITNATIMVNDFPGVLAYYSKNRIFSTDLLATNVTFVKELQKQPHQLHYLLDFFAAQNRPVEYILYIDTGAKFLMPTNHNTVLQFSNAKAYPLEHQGDTLTVGEPVEQNRDFILWRLKR